VSSSSIAVGRAATEDVAAIAQFNIAMAAETEDLALDPQTVHAGVAAVVSDDRRGFYLVARSDGKAVGSLMITYEWSDWRNGNLWWIQSVYVMPSARKQGIFRLLYDNVISLAKQDGDAAGVRLYVEKDNRGAQEVYRKLGMSETSYRVFEIIF
jgi:ribosomal protein S18 acetylase RimI-like enzyme